MDKLWYYAKNSIPVGPVAFEVLKQMAAMGQLAPDDLVWTQGMTDWVPANRVKELFSSGYPNPPPILDAPAPTELENVKVNRPATPYAPPMPGALWHGATRVTYAGFWKRFAALVLDQVLVVVAVGLILAVVMDFEDATSEDVEILFNFFGIVIGWAYYAGMESSRLQGTLGKLVLGIKVTDDRGNRISFGRATGRHLAKILSSCLLIGFLMAAFTEKKQALHDIVAGCLVVNR